MGSGLQPPQNQTDADTGPAWQRLERLLADHYREQGYEVTAPSDASRRHPSRRSIDLGLRRGDEYLLLRCRRSAREPVSHQQVLDLLKAIAREGANGAILVTGGSFSNAARAASLRHESLQLVDGDELQTLFNPALVEAFGLALETEREAGETEPPAVGDPAPRPSPAEAADPIREEDWDAEPEPANAAGHWRRFAIPLVFVAMALGGWGLYRALETAATRHRADAAASAPPSAATAVAPPPAAPGTQPNPFQEQARQKVIALEGVTSAAWLPNGVLLLGMRDTTRTDQERATEEACAILASYPGLAGTLVEVQDTGRGWGERRELQVSCL